MEYFTLLTQKGSEKIAAATAANTTVNLTYIALGDGNGTVPMPDTSKIALVNEVYRAPLNDLRVDEQNANWLVAEGYVPSDEGNFWVREVGIFDSDGDLIIIGNYPETFKPVTADGIIKDLYMKVITEVSSADAVALLVDPSVVMASQEFVNERLDISKLNEKLNLHNNDEFVLSDSEDNSKRKKTTWMNIKTKIKNYLLTGYSANFTRQKGHIRLPDMFGNFTINWGNLTVNANHETYINLDLAYDNTHFIALCSSGGDVLGSHDAQIEIAGKAQVLLGTTQTEIISWFSIGK